ADSAGVRVGELDGFVLVVARRVHVCELRSIRAPYEIGHVDVVAQHGAVIGRSVLETDHLRVVHVDDYARDHRDHTVTWIRALPVIQVRVAHARVDEIHVADVAIILLLCSDLFRVRRPENDWTIAVYPACVVGCVAEIFLAVRGQLLLATRGDVADPEIPVANECDALSVRRHSRRRSERTGSRRRIVHRVAGAAANVTAPASPPDVEDDVLSIRGQLGALRRNVARIDRARARMTQGLRHFGSLEQRSGRLFRGIDDHPFGAGWSRVLIVEPVVGQPRGSNGAAAYKLVEVRREHLHRAVVVGRGEYSLLSMDCRRGSDDRASESYAEMATEVDGTMGASDVHCRAGKWKSASAAIDAASAAHGVRAATLAGCKS